MRTVAKSFAVACGLILAGTALHAQTNVVSDPVGFYKISIVPGGNVISAPMQPIQAYRGLAGARTANSVTFSTAASFAVNQFAPVTVATGTGNVQFNQYILVLRQTAKGITFTNTSFVNPANPVITNNFSGDWWPIASNGTNSVTVTVGADDLTTHMNAGDSLEIRKLTSLKDLLGAGSSYVLAKSADGNADPSVTDVIRTLSGTSFQHSIVYYEEGSDLPNAGYLINGSYPGVDGSTITFEPDESLVVFRKIGSTNAVSLGQVQTTPLTHYLSPGANVLGSPFPANQLLLSAGIENAQGFKADVNGSADPADGDVVRSIAGVSFIDTFSKFAGENTTPFPSQWFVNGGSTDETTYNILPTKSYVYFVKAGSGGRVWRQPLPYTP